MPEPAQGDLLAQLSWGIVECVGAMGPVPGAEQTWG
jgi:hypothetical protein